MFSHTESQLLESRHVRAVVLTYMFLIRVDRRPVFDWSWLVGGLLVALLIVCVCGFPVAQGLVNTGCGELKFPEA